MGNGTEPEMRKMENGAENDLTGPKPASIRIHHGLNVYDDEEATVVW